MKVVLLGTSGYHPTDQRETACVMLPEIGLVFDAGTAMYRVRDYLATETLDIFLSHAHLDHVIGLTYLLSLQYQTKLGQVRVHGIPDKLAAVDEHLFATPLFPLKPKVEFSPLGGSVSVGRGGRLSYFPLKHPGGSVGFRVDWPDRSLAYVTDTTADVDADYVEAIRGVDLLIHECHFADDAAQMASKTGHSCPLAVAQVAATAKVDRVVLSHIGPLTESAGPLELKEARRVFGRIQLGEDRMQIDF